MEEQILQSGKWERTYTQVILSSVTDQLQDFGKLFSVPELQFVCKMMAKISMLQDYCEVKMKTMKSLPYFNTSSFLSITVQSPIWSQNWSIPILPYMAMIQDKIQFFYMVGSFIHSLTLSVVTDHFPQ